MQLQKGPLGILGWFALKVGGQNPPLFGDAVLPVVEVGDNYLLTAELQVKNAVMATALSTFNTQTLTVPNGKLWRLHSVSLFGGLNAADAALLTILAIGLVPPASGANAALVATLPTQSGAVPRTLAQTFRPPIVLPSGWGVNFMMFTNTAITITSNLQCNALVHEVDL